MARRQAVGLVILSVFLVPAWVMTVLVTADAVEAEPHVEALAARAEADGLELMPDVVYEVGFGRPDEIPPGAVEQNEFIDHARDVFHGNPVDLGVLYWPLLIAAAFVLTVWSLAGIAISGAIGGRLGAVAAVVTIATAGALWAPLVYYRDVIDVVTYYTD